MDLQGLAKCLAVMYVQETVDTVITHCSGTCDSWLGLQHLKDVHFPKQGVQVQEEFAVPSCLPLPKTHQESKCAPTQDYDLYLSSLYSSSKERGNHKS